MAARLKHLFLGSLPFLVVAVVWQLSSASGVIPTTLIPPPLAVVRTFWRLSTDGTLARLAGISALNILPAFLCASFAAIAFGLTIGTNEVSRLIASPALAAISSVPSLAWLPLVVIAFGFDRRSLWAVVFISSFTKIVYSVIAGVQSIPLSYRLIARNAQLGRGEALIKIMMPAALSHILAGIRLGFGSAWRSLVGAEMVMTTANGLGKFIWASQWNLDFERVFAGIVTIAFVGVTTELVVFRAVENATVIKWGMHVPT